MSLFSSKAVFITDLQPEKWVTGRGQGWMMLALTMQGLLTPALSLAQSTAHHINVPNTAESTVNPRLGLDQFGTLTNTRVNTHPLGKLSVGKAFSNCTTSGLAVSMFGNGIGPFDTGILGGSFTYTQSMGMEACKQHTRSQLTRLKLETCWLLMNNYAKMQKVGIKVSYQALQKSSGVECPNLSLEQIAPSISH